VTPAASPQPGAPLAQASTRTPTAVLTPPASAAASATRSPAPPVTPTATPPPSGLASFNPVYYYPSHELPVSYQGSGPFTLAPNGVLELYIAPGQGVEFTQVLSVTFHLAPPQAGGTQDQASGLLLGLFLRSYYETRGQSTWLEPVHWGANPFRGFKGFVDRLGGMHVILNNKTSQPVTVQEFGVQVTIRRVDGSQAVIGFQP